MSQTDQQTAPQAPVAGEHPTAPAPRKKSWFARHKVLTALLVLVVLGIFAAIGGGGEDASTADAGSAVEAPAGEAAAADVENAGADVENAADESAAAEPVADEQPGIGDAVRDGKFEFTVTEVETGIDSVGDEFLSEDAQGQFVFVHMSVSNIGDEAQMLSGSNQTLVDTQGREHSANTSAAIYLDGSGTFLNDINPGNSVDGVVVFDIPADAEPASIELHDSVFSGGVTVSLQ